MNIISVMSVKSKRDIIFNKFDGKCAFCGHPLGKGWHVWDIEPVSTVVTPSGDLQLINEEVENLLPACKPCGSLRIKSRNKKMTIEEFRSEVAQSFEFLRYGGITATSYGRAIRFGLIQETGKKLEFYFETIKTHDTRKSN